MSGEIVDNYNYKNTLEKNVINVISNVEKTVKKQKIYFSF